MKYMRAPTYPTIDNNSTKGEINLASRINNKMQNLTKWANETDLDTKLDHR